MSGAQLLLKNAGQLLTLAGNNQAPRRGGGMRELGVMEHGSVWINHSQITAVGKNGHGHDAEVVIDCTGKVVMPGFVDPHTHLVFAGSREDELAMKLEGKGYMDILRSGGGILSTVRRTREASQLELVSQAQKRLDTMLRFGTTTVEAKSGYGLDHLTEIKMLQAVRELDEVHPIDLVPTFLGAHAVPEEFEGRGVDYIEHMAELLPRLKEEGLAEFCDVFCERGAFSVEESRRLLAEAKAQGLGLKIHADEIENIGGAGLAAELGAVSAEHLVKTSQEEMKAMADAGVIGVLLPGTPYSLMDNEYPNAPRMMELGMPLALATDLNPNCWTESMQFIVSLACYKMRMTPEEAIVASTINAAHAVKRADIAGSLEVGKKADIIVLDIPNYLHLPYHFGVNLVETVIKDGKVAVGGA